MKKKKILIVDDEEDICMLLSGYLKNKGYETCKAHTLETAVSTFREEEPEIVILDVNLPDGECFEILPYIKSKDDIKVIIITARDGDREYKMAKKMEVDDFIRKPFKYSRLNEALDKITQV